MAPICALDPIPSGSGPLGGQSSWALDVDASQDGYGKWSLGMAPFWGSSTATHCLPSVQSTDGSVHMITPQLRFGRQLPTSFVPLPTSCQSSLPSGLPSGAPRFFATDASEEGCGVCSARWDRSTVARVGRLKERSRFCRSAGLSARDSFFQAASFRLGDDGQWKAAEEGLEEDGLLDEPVARSSKEGQWFSDDSFPEVPFEELDERK